MNIFRQIMKKKLQEKENPVIAGKKLGVKGRKG